MNRLEQAKRHGTIVDDEAGAPDQFVHATAERRAGFAALVEGQRLEFSVEMNGRTNSL
jgi:cold shock CspA family protein